MRVHILAGFFPLFLLLFVGGCKLGKLDLEDFPCDEDQNCAEGFDCDVTNNVCVGDTSPCSAEGNLLSCSPGQWRVCTAGTWGPCRVIACTPQEKVCSDGQVFVCDGTGKLQQADDCGAAGCRDSQCLACRPGQEPSCDGNTVITCNADGSKVLTRTVCGDGGCGSVCQAGQCVAGMVAEGTACNGGDDDFCDSSCNNAGECVEVVPDCTDGKVCTEDSCVDATGCVNDSAALLGTSCGSGADRCTASCSAGGECLDLVPVDCSGAGACAVCDGGSGECVAGKEKEECRAAVAGGCDIAESCDGGSKECPKDGFKKRGDVCLKAQAGALCDLKDVCDGVSAACVARYRPSDYECGAAAVDGSKVGCDVAESCSGDTAECPADIVLVTGEQCRNATCDVGTYSSFGCSAAGDCIETTDMCGVCAAVPSAACSVDMGCVSSTPRDCSEACGTCAEGADPVTCDPATDTCSGNIPDGCKMVLEDLGNMQITVDTGCRRQIVTCQAIGRFFIVKDVVEGNTFNTFDGTAASPAFGWQGAVSTACSKIPTGCPGGGSDVFAGVAAITAGVGTFSFIADVSGFTEIQHFFHAGESAELEDPKKNKPAEFMRLRYCCGDQCTTEGDPLWSLAGTSSDPNWASVQQRDHFTVGNVPDFGSFPLLAGCQAATSPALRPRNILRTEFAVNASKKDEFGIDNFTLTGLTAVDLEMASSVLIVRSAELPPDAPEPADASLEYKCTWQATGQTESITVMVPQ